LKELDALAQSIFYEMFGDPIENDKGWEVKKLGDVCSLKAGKAIKANELSDVASYNLYPCFGGNGIRGYIEKVSHHNQYPIIGRQGALCGNVVLSTKEFYATEHAVVVQPVVEMNICWSYYTLMYMNLNRLAQGVAQPGLSVGRVNQEDFILPPIDLQKQFASKIEVIEKQKELIKQSIQEAETLFNSRMDYYFN
jgi:type I restriction enzyme S subunit